MCLFRSVPNSIEIHKSSRECTVLAAQIHAVKASKYQIFATNLCGPAALSISPSGRLSHGKRFPSQAMKRHYEATLINTRDDTGRM